MDYKYTFIPIANQISKNLNIIDSTHNIINNLIIRLAIKIITAANKISILSKKKIISILDIKTSVLIIIKDELAQYSISDGIRAVAKYKNKNKNSKSSIEQLSGLQLSFDTTKHLFTNYITKNKTVHKETIIYLTAILEFISAEIIQLSTNSSNNNNKLLPRHIFIAISNDTQLKHIFKGYILGSNTTKYIDNSLKYQTPKEIFKYTLQNISKSAFNKLMLKAGVKYKSSLIYDDSIYIFSNILELIICNTIHITNNKKRKTVKFEDGIIALDILNIEIYADKLYPGQLEPCKGKTKILLNNNSNSSNSNNSKKSNILNKIKIFQNTECTLLPHSLFHKLINNIAYLCNNSSYKFEQNYIWLVQAILEDYMVDLYKNTLLIASHSNRLTIMPKDLLLAHNIKNY